MASKSIRQRIKEELAEEPMTSKHLSLNIGCSLVTIKTTLTKMSADWEVKEDKSFKGQEKYWTLTVPAEPSKSWTFKELLRNWR